jgi:uncharacterized protein YukE
MPQAHADPEEIKKFARMLKVFNQDLTHNTKKLQGQFQHLGEAWKDRQFQDFAQEFERLIHMLHQFVQSSEQQIPLLQRKAKKLEVYLSGSPAAASTAVSPDFTTSIFSPGEPTGSTHSSPGQWVDRGIQNVCLADLPQPEGINRADDFKKVSLAVMQAGIQRLQEMLPIIESGVGQSKDYWAHIDQEHKLTYEYGYQRIYEVFYGENAIRLEHDGNSYHIINGRHRLWLAKQMGIKSLPAKVVERQGYLS